MPIRPLYRALLRLSLRLPSQAKTNTLYTRVRRELALPQSTADLALSLELYLDNITVSPPFPLHSEC